ncbi:MAG: exopolyphosphatase [Gammaproteobacteria bacterium]|nr:exopolyphosphatase [Gammaproteobacteria bacterium]
MFKLPANTDTIAAVDLGSNSFHMIVAKVDKGNFQVIDKIREMVRLGAGITAEKLLTEESESRALACLKRFGQRLGSLPPGSVRAAGTNTLRQVRDSGRFLRKAEEALGHPIEVIAGREEARLIYLGVSHSLATGEERSLVVDIGGGSTELIIGNHFVPNYMESIHMGCVSMSRRFFSDGRISRSAMRKAELSGALEMRPVKTAFRNAGWENAIGCSGTIRAIQTVIAGMGLSEERDGITREALLRLRDRLIEFGHIDHIELDGLSSERQPVFVGGVAVLCAVFKALEIERMQISDMALREGLLYDMLGRIHHEDVRQNTIDTLTRRYEVESAQAERVEAIARRLFEQARESWQLTSGEYEEMLAWAAQLHEIGLTVSHSQYHKHGAYLIANSDMAGFSRQEQLVLATLVRGHRRKFPQEVFEALPPDTVQCARQLCVLLRIAVLLRRARSAARLVDVRLRVERQRLELSFPAGWLKSHPLHKTELKQEKKRLKAAGFKLKFG